MHEQKGREPGLHVMDGRSVVEHPEHRVVERVAAEEFVETGDEAVAALRLGREIEDAVERDDGGDARRAVRAHRGESDEVAAGRLAREGDAPGVDAVVGGVGFHPTDGGLDILDGRGVAKGGREPVVDGEPGEARGTERRVHRHHVALLRPAVFIATAPAAAVDENHGRVRSGSVRDECVEAQADAGGRAVFEVGEQGRMRRRDRGEGEQDKMPEFHRWGVWA